MTSPIRRLPMLAATLIAALLLQLGALVASTSAEANIGTGVVISAVNVRTGPGTQYPRLAVIYPGDSVEVTGNTGPWAIVKYKGRTAYVHTDYLSIKTTSATQISTGGPSGIRYSVANLNVRTGPSLANSIVKLVPGGTAFTLTGRASNGFSEVTYAGAKRWVWTAYISTTAPKASALPKITGKMKLTGRLMIRSDDTPNFVSLGKLPIGSIIDVTGIRRNGVVQAVYQGQLRWFDANWVVPYNPASTGPTPPRVPGAIGTRYSKENLNVRAQASTSSTLLGTAVKGTVFQVTGKVSNGYAEIVWNSRTAWVAAQYLVNAVPGQSLLTSWSSGLDSLLPNGKRIVNTVHTKFPRIKVMYGVRFDPIPDHPSGKAVDIMIPDYKNNQAYGWEIANYMRANAKALNIRYIIHGQRIWSAASDARGWRWMADRGSDNANHYNHVHVTTY